jgi:arylsulfatase A-like enzyme
MKARARPNVKRYTKRTHERSCLRVPAQVGSGTLSERHLTAGTVTRVAMRSGLSRFSLHSWALFISAALALALAVVSGAGSWSSPPGDRSTSVLLISVDTLRADHLNCYGYQRRRTSPNIDALAADGVLAESQITASPWTTPSHLSMMTSLPPTRHGVLSSFRDLMRGLHGESSFERLPDSRLTLAEALKASGRATAAFTGGVTLDPRLGFDQGFDSYDVSMVKLGPRSMRLLTQWIATHRHKPFFMFWHTFEVHAPYVDARFIRGRLPPKRAHHLSRVLGRIARRARQDAMGKLVDDGELALRESGAFRPDVCIALYDGGIRSFDDRLGEMVRVLKAAGLYDSMLIVLTSDHGQEFAEHQDHFYDSHGRGLYSELVHVPLIIKLPQQRAAGTRLPRVSSALDVMPTILDVVGATPEPNEMEGVSLRPRWEHRAGAGTFGALSEGLAEGHEQKSLRRGKKKLIITIPLETVQLRGRAFVPEHPGRELFDLAADPGEEHDLIEQPDSPAKIESEADRMETQLRRRLGEPGKPDRVTLDDAALVRLPALGYLD